MYISGGGEEKGRSETCDNFLSRVRPRVKKFYDHVSMNGLSGKVAAGVNKKHKTQNKSTGVQCGPKNDK